MRRKRLLFMHISYTISYVRRMMSYVKIQVLASRTCDIVYDVVYDIVCFLYGIVRATYDIAEKRTTSYVFYKFLPVVRATSNTTSYVFWRCRVRCAMQHRYYTMSYGRFRCRWFTSPKTYVKCYDVVCNIVAYDIPYLAYDMLAWGGGRRGGTYWPCPSSSHGSCFLILGPAGWFVLHRHSVESLSLTGTHGASQLVGADRQGRVSCPDPSSMACGLRRSSQWCHQVTARCKHIRKN